MDPLLFYWLLQVARLLLDAADKAVDLLVGWSFSKGGREEREAARKEGYKRSSEIVYFTTVELGESGLG